jgi:hypothetical protein
MLTRVAWVSNWHGNSFSTHKCIILYAFFLIYYLIHRIATKIVSIYLSPNSLQCLSLGWIILTEMSRKFSNNNTYKSVFKRWMFTRCSFILITLINVFSIYFFIHLILFWKVLHRIFLLTLWTDTLINRPWFQKQRIMTPMWATAGKKQSSTNVIYLLLCNLRKDIRIHNLINVFSKRVLFMTQF